MAGQAFWNRCRLTRGSTETYGPRVCTKACVPRGCTETWGPRGSTETCGPRGCTETRGPRRCPETCRLICTKGSSYCSTGLSIWHSLPYPYTKCFYIPAPSHQRQHLRWSHRFHLKQLGRWEGEGDSNHFLMRLFCPLHLFFSPTASHSFLSRH